MKLDRILRIHLGTPTLYMYFGILIEIPCKPGQKLKHYARENTGSGSEPRFTRFTIAHAFENVNYFDRTVRLIYITIAESPVQRIIGHCEPHWFSRSFVVVNTWSVRIQYVDE